MNRQEESQYPIEQMVSQEEPSPRPLFQILAAFAFIGFIIVLPVLIERLGK